jgi:hypothetical protein
VAVRLFDLEEPLILLIIPTELLNRWNLSYVQVSKPFSKPRLAMLVLRESFHKSWTVVPQPSRLPSRTQSIRKGLSVLRLYIDHSRSLGPRPCASLSKKPSALFLFLFSAGADMFIPSSPQDLSFRVSIVRQ